MSTTGDNLAQVANNNEDMKNLILQEIALVEDQEVATSLLGRINLLTAALVSTTISQANKLAEATGKGKTSPILALSLNLITAEGYAYPHY